jgi:hypothetical protein
MLNVYIIIRDRDGQWRSLLFQNSLYIIFFLLLLILICIAEEFLNSFEPNHDRLAHEVLRSVLSEMQSSLVKHLHDPLIVRILGIKYLRKRLAHPMQSL